MKLDPPRLTRGPLSGKVFVVTHGKIVGVSTEAPHHEIINASVKYDVTEQFDSLVAQLPRDA
jgi:hypothetical protein